MGFRRPAFTLVEILIVVVLLAILAATIVPQFSSSSKDAEESSAAFSLQGLRSQIELYKAQHASLTPSTLDKLTSRTDAQGNVGTDPVTYPFGPYMPHIPDNPFNQQRTAEAISSYPPSGVGASTSGWLYHSTSGNVFLNHADWLNR
jgi:prepilin-type N-terminal cleavage/methylation domain-containing protein